MSLNIFLFISVIPLRTSPGNTYISVDWKWCRIQVDNLFSSDWLRKHFKSPPYRSGALQDQGSGFNSESWSSTARKTCAQQTNNQLLNLLVTNYVIDLLMLMNPCTPKSVSGCFFSPGGPPSSGCIGVVWSTKCLGRWFVFSVDVHLNARSRGFVY